MCLCVASNVSAEALSECHRDGVARLVLESGDALEDVAGLFAPPVCKYQNAASGCKFQESRLAGFYEG